MLKEGRSDRGRRNIESVSEADHGSTKIDQWNNNGYLHNFVTDLRTEKGAGREIIKAVEALAVNDHKERVRLRLSIDNPFLNQYYESMGYEMVGTCKDGGGMKAIGVKIYGITIEKNKS